VADDAIVSIQCTSPLIAPQAYWCILRTMESAGFKVRPYQATVPSFGVWGFALASPGDVPPPQQLATAVAGKTRFLNDAGLRSLFDLPNDLQPRDVEINRLDSQALVRYYEAEWRQWN
jgi:spermidine synthase